MSKITQTGDGAFSIAKYIVSKQLGEGTHQTISQALLDSSSNDTIFIKPGTYTENLSLRPGINIAALSADSIETVSKVTILGKATLSEPGNVSISGISLKTNGDLFLSLEGSAAGVVTLQNCFLDCTDHNGILVSSSGVDLNCVSCKGELRTTEITYATSTGVSKLSFFYCKFRNVGRSIQPLTTSTAGILNFLDSSINSPIDVRGTSTLNLLRTTITTSTLGGVGGAASKPVQIFSNESNEITNCWIDGGTLPAIDVNIGGNLGLRGSNSILSNNASTIIGAGTIRYSPCDFPAPGNKATINVPSRVVNPIGRDIIVSGTINAYLDETHALSMTEDGEFTYPLHPSFSAVLTTNRTNVTGTGTIYPIVFDLKIFDQGNDFNLVTSIFTASVSGRYRFNARGCIENGVNMNQVNLKLLTSNRDYTSSFIMGTGLNIAQYTAQLNQLCDMDAGDTARVEIFSSGEIADTNTVSGNANNYTAFSGNLEA